MYVAGFDCCDECCWGSYIRILVHSRRRHPGVGQLLNALGFFAIFPSAFTVGLGDELVFGVHAMPRVPELAWQEHCGVPAEPAGLRVAVHLWFEVAGELAQDFEAGRDEILTFVEGEADLGRVDGRLDERFGIGDVVEGDGLREDRQRACSVRVPSDAVKTPACARIRYTGSMIFAPSSSHVWRMRPGLS